MKFKTIKLNTQCGELGFKLAIIKHSGNTIGLNCGWLVKRSVVFMDKVILIRANLQQ